MIFPLKPDLPTAFSASVNDNNLPSISSGQILRAVLDFSLFLSHPILANPAGFTFRIPSRANHFSPTLLHHHELSHQILLPGLLLLPPNYLPSSIPCSSIVNSQNSRQSNIVFFFKSSQVYSPPAQIFHWFFISLKMKAEDVRVASRTMYPLAPLHLPLHLRPLSLLLICFHRCVSETHHHVPP